MCEERSARQGTRVSLAHENGIKRDAPALERGQDARSVGLFRRPETDEGPFLPMHSGTTIGQAPTSVFVCRLAWKNVLGVSSRRCNVHWYLRVVGLMVLLALPLSASAQERTARYWVKVESDQPGTHFQYKRAGDTEWTDFQVGVPVEYDSSTPVEVRNIGEKTGFIVDQGSSTGNINDIDRNISESFSPGAQAEYSPGVMVIIAGNVIGVVKGILNLIGSLFTFTVGAASHGTAKTAMVTTSAAGELTLSAQALAGGAACFAVQCDNGGHSIVASSQADPILRSLQGAGAAIWYDAAGNMTSYVPLGQITAGPCDSPTLSQWGLIVLTLLLLTAGTLVVRRQRRRAMRVAV